MNQVQVITHKGRPQWAVIPYQDYLDLCELNEVAHTVRHFKQALACGDEELLPEAMVKRLTKGESPIRVWREYRGLTQKVLAEQVHISVPYLSQLESQLKTPSVNVLSDLAEALNVTLDDLA